MSRVAATSAPLPILDLGRVHGPLAGELVRDFERVLASGQFILGSEHDAFERELAAACGLRHAVGAASGTAALSLSLAALGIGAGDEVLVPAFTYVATASSVTQLGARPVFVDVEPERYGMDPGLLEAAIGPRARAIMPVHLFGLAAGRAGILAVAARHGIPVLEDAAQAIGARDGGGPVGVGSAGAALSFFPTKNLGALGDGGAVVTNDSALAERMRLLRVHGDAGGYRHVVLGTNARLDALQAAFLRTKLRHLERWTEERRAIAGRYGRGLAGLPLVLPTEPEGSRHTYHQYTIRCEVRDRLQAFLGERGVGSRVYYPIPLPAQPCLAHAGYREGAYPVAERLAREVLSIPIYPGLREDEVERVITAIREFFGAGPEA